MNNKTVYQVVFFGGIIIAVLLGLGVKLPYYVRQWLPVLGIIVGFIGVKNSQNTNFLLAGLVILNAKWVMKTIPYVGAISYNVTNKVLIFLAPALIVTALKALYDMTKP